MKETKQMTLQLDRKVRDSNTCSTLKHKIHYNNNIVLEVLMAVLQSI